MDSEGEGASVSRLTVKQAANYLNVHEDYVRKLVREGALPSNLRTLDVMAYKVKRDAVRDLHLRV